MHFKIVAIDLDGTIAEHGVVSDETFAVLRKAKEAGFAFILVTGRRLSVLSKIGPFEEICEAIVGENGAAIYYPANEQVVLPFGTLDFSVMDKLDRLNIPLEKGMAIAATWKPHDNKVVDVLSATGYAATIEYNKGAVMVLPPGATKGTGLMVALLELGYSPRNLLAIGDAENDRSMFNLAELSIAVFNAVPGIKEIADVILEDPDGAGFRKLMNDLLDKKIPSHISRPDRRIKLGKMGNDTSVILDPTNFLNGNFAIMGESGSGKSWLAGLLVENLLRLDYQVLIIDPEGDYRGLKSFPHTMLIGGSDKPPLPVVDVTTICEYTNISIILDLSLYSIERQREYVYDLLFGLSSLKVRRGKPHWILVDEIQYFCPLEGSRLTDLFLDQMRDGGLGVVSFRPGLVSPALLNIIDHWLFTRMEEPSELKVLQDLFARKHIENDHWEDLPKLTTKKAYLHIGATAQKDAPKPGIVEFYASRRVVPHVRHLHKYLRAPLPASKRFYFYLNEGDAYQGTNSAASLWEFTQVIGDLPAYSLEYHMERKDFERWAYQVLHDKELARRINKIGRKKLKGEALQKALEFTVRKRFEVLARLV